MEEIKEFTQEYLPEQNLLKLDSIPGVTSDKLDASFQIRGVETKMYVTNATRLASAGTGIWTITGVVDSNGQPFVPKVVQIYAGRNSASATFSYGSALNYTNGQCILTSSAGTTYDFNNIIRSGIDANLLNCGSGEIRLNVSNAYYDTYLVITVFG